MRSIAIFLTLVCVACGNSTIDVDSIGDAGQNDYPMGLNDTMGPGNNYLWSAPNEVLQPAIPPMVIGPEAYNINERILVLVDENAEDCQVTALHIALRYYATKWGYADLEEVFDVFFVEEMGEDWQRVSMRTVRVIFADEVLLDGEPKTALGGSFWVDESNVDTWIGGIIMLDECLGGTGHSRVFIHEFGHVFHLAHHDDPNNIMHPIVDPYSTMEYEQLELAHEFARLHTGE